MYGQTVLEKKDSSIVFDDEPIKIERENGSRFITINRCGDLSFEDLKRKIFEEYCSDSNYEVNVDEESIFIVKSTVIQSSYVQLSILKNKLVINIHNCPKPSFLDELVNHCEKNRDKFIQSNESSIDVERNLIKLIGVSFFVSLLIGFCLYYIIS